MSGPKDTDGNVVMAGDTIMFSYGIPPIGVHAKLIDRDGKLIALTPGHIPAGITLRNLAKHYSFCKVIQPRSSSSRSRATASSP